MKPLYPAIFKVDEVADLNWADKPENITLFRHILNTCLSFPSLIMACSAREGLQDVAAALSATLGNLGVNVFMPAAPAPLCSLSQALGSRNMPLGLYLDADEKLENISLTALSIHGGPFDEKDIVDALPATINKPGVAGITELDRYYASNLAGLADSFIEPGKGFSAIEIPFPDLENILRETAALKALFQPDPEGPAAIVSADGQGLCIVEKNGDVLPTAQVASVIADYLIKDRLTSGTIIGPENSMNSIAADCEKIGIVGSVFDMSHQAAFTDLLIGWWNNGIIAHQGSSCFGDAILSAVYYLEACRSGR
ncbi:MAG: hypothetical protein EOM80_03725 [Erysipelotrichia bacterium]|nr:hypothetical protein [Erysipelotrichia bacterium]